MLDKLAPWMTTRRGPWTASEALPGGEFDRSERASELARLVQDYARLDKAFLTRLFARHGLLARAVLGAARTPAELGTDFGGGLTQREVDYLVANEWAQSSDDILWRRTKCGLHMTAPQRAAFTAAFSASMDPQARLRA